MKDSGLWAPDGRELRDPDPRHTVLLAAPPKRASPQPGNVVAERAEGPRIRGHGVVRKEALDHLPESHFPCAGIGSCMRSRNASLISRSFARMRSPRVFL